MQKWGGTEKHTYYGLGMQRLKEKKERFLNSTFFSVSSFLIEKSKKARKITERGKERSNFNIKKFFVYFKKTSFYG